MRLAASIAVFLITASLARAWHDEASVQIERINRRIADAPGDAGLYLERAELYRQEAVWARALADCDRAVELDPEVRGAELLRARVRLARGAPRAAHVHVERHLATNPTDIPAILVRAEIEAALGRPAAAIRDYDRAIELSEAPPPDWYLARADQGFARGPRFADETLAALDGAAERLGYVPTLQERALELELGYGRIDQALRRVDRLIERAPPKESWLCRRGEILLAAQRTEEALEAFTQALSHLSRRPARRLATPALVALRERITRGLRAARSAPPQ